MSFYEALKLAFASILSHKLRSFLTLLGVIFGVSTVIVLRAHAVVLALQQSFWDRYGVGRLRRVLHPVSMRPAAR